MADSSDLATVDNDDGTWSVVRDDGLVVGDRQEIGAITWEYQGQVPFEDDVTPVPPQFVTTTSGMRDRSITGQILGSRRYDEEEGLWMAVDVDTDAMESRIADYDDAIFTETGITESPADFGASEMEYVEGERYWFEPESWTYVYCSTEGGAGYRILGSDDRLRSTSLTSRQKAGAFIQTDYGAVGKGHCGGVFLDSDSVLTAAHCIWDDGTDAPVHNSKVKVCTQGNEHSYGGAHCASVSNILAPAYSSGWHPSHDYAILNLSSAPSGHTTMYMSVASDSIVTDYDMHNIAYPLHSPPSGTCTSNVGTPEHAAIDYGLYLSSAMGPISAPFSTFHFDIDGGGGYSGSPVYYCGDAWCDTGEAGFVVSVWVGWNGFYTTHVGPKVRTFRTWALGVI